MNVSDKGLAESDEWIDEKVGSLKSSEKEWAFHWYAYLLLHKSFLNTFWGKYSVSI